MQSDGRNPYCSVGGNDLNLNSNKYGLLYRRSRRPLLAGSHGRNSPESVVPSPFHPLKTSLGRAEGLIRLPLILRNCFVGTQESEPTASFTRGTHRVRANSYVWQASRVDISEFYRRSGSEVHTASLQKRGSRPPGRLLRWPVAGLLNGGLREVQILVRWHRLVVR